MYRYDKLQYDQDRASLCESLLQDLMHSTAMMARVNRDDMLSAQPRPHGCVCAESLGRLYTELKGCAQTLQNVSKPSSIDFSMIPRGHARAAITSILTDLLLRMLPVVWTSPRGSLKINSMLCAVNLRSFLRTNDDDVARTTNLIRLSHGRLSTSSTSPMSRQNSSTNT